MNVRHPIRRQTSSQTMNHIRCSVQMNLPISKSYRIDCPSNWSNAICLCRTLWSHPNSTNIDANRRLCWMWPVHTFWLVWMQRCPILVPNYLRVNKKLWIWVEWMKPKTSDWSLTQQPSLIEPRTTVFGSGERGREYHFQFTAQNGFVDWPCLITFMRIQQWQQFATRMPCRIIGKILFDFFRTKFQFCLRCNAGLGNDITTIVPNVNCRIRKRIKNELKLDCKAMASGTHNSVHLFANIRCKWSVRVANSVQWYSQVSNIDDATHNTISDSLPNKFESTTNLCRKRLAPDRVSPLSNAANIHAEYSTVSIHRDSVAAHRPSIASVPNRSRCKWRVSQ